MTRKKVKLVWIASDNARKASFKKRRLGLMKKVSELTTLCGVYAFAVVHGPDDDHPVIWPSRSAAQQLYRRFQSLPEVERQKKMTNQETYLKERTAKAQDQLKKHIKKNQDLEMDLLMHQLHQGRQIYQLSNAELLGLFWMVEEKMRDSRKRIEYHHQVHRLPPPCPGFSPSPLLQTGNDMDLIDNTAGDGRNLMDQWFIDMVMNSSDKIGGGSSSMAGELGFQNEAIGNGFNCGGGNSNSMIHVVGDLGGNATGCEAEGLGGGKLGEIAEDNNENLLSHWNFGGNHSSGGMSEIEKLVSNINGGVDDQDTTSPMDFIGIGGDMSMGMYCDGGGAGGGSDAELFHSLFGGSSSNENENEIETENDLLNKGWPNHFTP